MRTGLTVLVLLALLAAPLVGCGNVQPCDGYVAGGPCNVGRHHDNSA